MERHERAAFCSPPIPGRELRVTFDGGRLTADAGVLVLAGIERRLGIAERLARCIEDPRAPERVHHTVADMIRFRVLLIAAGYPDANDCDALRSDAAFKMALGRAPESGAERAVRLLECDLDRLIADPLDLDDPDHNARNQPADECSGCQLLEAHYPARTISFNYRFSTTYDRFVKDHLPGADIPVVLEGVGLTRDGDHAGHTQSRSGLLAQYNQPRNPQPSLVEWIAGAVRLDPMGRRGLGSALRRCPAGRCRRRWARTPLATIRPCRSRSRIPWLFRADRRAERLSA
jgi:hypothetical protein